MRTRLIEILARRRPELVTEVLFSDEDGRMLMRDAGEQLSVLDRDLDRTGSRRFLCTPSSRSRWPGTPEQLVEAGAFDRRSAVLPAEYRELIAERAPGQTAEEYEQLLALEPEVDRVCAELAAGPVPETINNDDFTDGSIYVPAATYRFLDWGDACVSHPFMTLTVTQRVIEIQPPASAGVRRRSSESAMPTSNRSRASHRGRSSRPWSSRRAGSAKSAGSRCARPTWTGRTTPKSWRGPSGSPRPGSLAELDR